MLKTQSGKRQREKLKNQRATARSMHQGTEGHVREVVEEPAHDFRMKGAIGKGTLLETVFHVREAGYEVEKRVVESRAPLVRTTNSTAQDSYYKELIPIPARPPWDPKMSAQQVQEAEDASFEAYLQNIYDRFPPYRLNHFEHNIHVWRQLWRVVDISDILVLVADARHPLFHVPPSLYRQCRRCCSDSFFAFCIGTSCSPHPLSFLSLLSQNILCTIARSPWCASSTKSISSPPLLWPDGSQTFAHDFLSSLWCHSVHSRMKKRLRILRPM
jgi:hypothetical protein